MAVDGPPPGPPAGTPNLTSEPSGGRHIGDYSVQRELGRGGMGAVYLAEHDLTHEKVAMKELLITAAADPIAVQRFLQEGAVMSRLTHPNIVGVRGHIEAGLGHYIALEFIEGGSLRDLLKGRPLPIPQAFVVMHGLLQALDYAHQHAIVHRDVKPENVMLSVGGEVKVADFGIARLTDDSVISNATKTEFNSEPIRLTFDASKAFMGGKYSHFVDLWVAYRYWQNKFGLDHNNAPGVCTLGGIGTPSTNSCTEQTVYAGVTVKF